MDINSQMYEKKSRFVNFEQLTRLFLFYKSISARIKPIKGRYDLFEQLDCVLVYFLFER